MRNNIYNIPSDIKRLRRDVNTLHGLNEVIVINGGGGGGNGEFADYYTKRQCDTKLNTKIDSDDVYPKAETYDKNTIDSKINSKANVNDTFTKTQITELIDNTEFNISKLEWDNNSLKNDGTVIIGNNNSATVTISDNTHTGDIIVGAETGDTNGVQIRSTNGTGSIKINGKRVLVEGDSTASNMNVSNLAWDTETLDGKSNTVIIGSADTGTLKVGCSTSAGATGNVNIGVNSDSGSGDGTVIVGKGKDGGKSTGKIVVGSSDDGASNGMLIKSTNGVGEVKINGGSVLTGDLNISEINWDQNKLKNEGTVTIGNNNSATVTISDNTHTGDVIVGAETGDTNGVQIRSTNGTGTVKINGKRVLVEGDSTASNMNVSNLAWDTETLAGKSNAVTIGSADTGTLKVGCSTSAGATGNVNIGVNSDSGSGDGTVIVGKGKDGGKSTGKIVVGSSDDGASNGMLIKSTNGVGEVKINGGSVLTGDLNISEINWDQNKLKNEGTVTIGNNNSATVTISDNTHTGDVIVGAETGDTNGVQIRSTNGTGTVKINGKRVLVEGDSTASNMNVSNLAWDTETLAGKSNAVTIGSADTGTLKVGCSTSAGATGNVNIGVNSDSGSGDGTVMVGKGKDGGKSTGKIVVGSSDDGASNGVLIKSTNGAGEVKINGGSVLTGDLNISEINWDNNNLKNEGTVIIGNNNSATVTISDNTHTGDIIVGAETGDTNGVQIRSTNGTGTVKINGKRVLVEGDSTASNMNVSNLAWDTETLAGKDGVVNVNGTLKSIDAQVNDTIISDGSVGTSGKFVAVGFNGTLAHSDNGTDFETGTITGNNAWMSVCYGNGKFVAVGYNGTLAHSDNGTTFDKGSIDGGNIWNSICYGNGKFVAAGDNALAHSDNGTTFYKATSQASLQWNSVCYGNGKFVVVGQGGCVYSDNGVDFNSGQIIGGIRWNSICYGNGKFVAVGVSGSYAYSSDGTKFTAGTITGNNDWMSVCYGNGKFVAVGSNGALAYSDNGTDFDKGEITGGNTWYSICYGNGKFVAVGDRSSYAYSEDGATFDKGTIRGGNNWYSICYKPAPSENSDNIITISAKNNLISIPDETTMNLKGKNNWIHFGDINDKGGEFNKFVAVGGDGALVHSDNGTNFTKGTIDSNDTWNSICYGDDKIVAVGNSGVFAYSENGTYFTKGEIEGVIYLNSVCYGNGKFVAVGGNGALVHSDNGTTFDKGSIDGNNIWESICYGNGKFVAVGAGVCAYSENGTKFTKGNIDDLTHFMSVCYGNDKFVAVGYDVFAYSRDGTDFTKGEIPYVNNLYSVCYGNGKFVAVGNNGTYVHSDEGTNFTKGTIDGNNIWKSVCYSNGKFVAVGVGVCAYSENGTKFTKGNITDVDTYNSICYAELLTPSTSGLTLYTNSSNHAHIFANGKDILPNIPSNPAQTSQTITHEAPFTSSIENYSLRKPVYATGTVKSFNKESSTWTNSLTNTDCICELKPSGTPDEFVGILVAYVDQNGIYTQYPTNARALLFATHGDFLFDVPSTENIKVGDLISIDGESIPDHTILTAKINNTIIGRCTSILNNNTISILKD